MKFSTHVKCINTPEIPWNASQHANYSNDWYTQRINHHLWNTIFSCGQNQGIGINTYPWPVVSESKNSAKCATTTAASATIWAALTLRVQMFYPLKPTVCWKSCWNLHYQVQCKWLLLSKTVKRMTNGKKEINKATESHSSRIQIFTIDEICWKTNSNTFFLWCPTTNSKSITVKLLKT